jgi:hypothetical protein
MHSGMSRQPRDCTLSALITRRRGQCRPTRSATRRARRSHAIQSPECSACRQGSGVPRRTPHPLRLRNQVDCTPPCYGYGGSLSMVSRRTALPCIPASRTRAICSMSSTHRAASLRSKRPWRRPTEQSTWQLEDLARGTMTVVFATIQRLPKSGLVLASSARGNQERVSRVVGSRRPRCLDCSQS